MEVKRHQGKSLRYLTIEPDGFNAELSYPLVILLHGFGASMDDLAGLCPAIDRQGYIYACPNAPLEFQLGPGVIGYGWTPPRSEGTAEDTRRVLEQLDVSIDEIIEQYHVAQGRALLMGFSQGGGMTYRYGLSEPGKFAGLAALSCYLPEPEEMRSRLPKERTQPIFISHGTHDEMAPVDMARRARDFLQEEGYTLSYNEYPISHEISEHVMADLVPWIKGVLPPVGIETR